MIMLCVLQLSVGASEFSNCARSGRADNFDKMMCYVAEK